MFTPRERDCRHDYGRFTEEQLLKQARAWKLRGRPFTSQAVAGMLLRNRCSPEL